MHLGTGWANAKFNKADFLEEERSSDVVRIEALIDSVCDHGCDYWCSSENRLDDHLKHRIPSDLHEIGVIVWELFRDDANLRKAVNIELDRFEDSITNGNFGIAEHGNEVERILPIRKTASALRSKVRTLRRSLKRKWFSFT